MIIIGERLNSTKPRVQEAIRNRDIAFIVKEAGAQIESGAHYVDINCAVTSGDEIQDIDWLVSVIQSEIPAANICIDSPNHLAIERALKVYKGKGEILINSVTADEERLRRVLPLAKSYRAKLVALTMDERGMPESAKARYDIAKIITERVRGDGFKPEDLYIDPLIRPISTEPAQGLEFLKALPMIKALPGIRTICGLSNISFGLPDRKLINSSFLTMAMYAGLDAAILDPLDKFVTSAISAARAILCDDEYCASYIKSYREGRLV